MTWGEFKQLVNSKIKDDTKLMWIDTECSSVMGVKVGEIVTKDGVWAKISDGE